MARLLGRTFAVFTLGAGIACASVMVHPAHAERVISDYEASRLTLGALTAAPVVHHVVYRHAATHSARGYAPRNVGSQAQVRSVVYRRAVNTATSHGRKVRHHT
jgi:hypothetical protein